MRLPGDYHFFIYVPVEIIDQIMTSGYLTCTVF